MVYKIKILVFAMLVIMELSVIIVLQLTIMGIVFIQVQQKEKIKNQLP